MKQSLGSSARLFTCLTITFFLLLTSAAQAQVQSDVEILDRTGSAFARVSREAKPAVVNIRVEGSAAAHPYGQEMEEFFNNPFFERFFGPQFRNQQPQPQQRRQQASGSGFIISKDGYILTNNHVVDQADKITVALSDGKQVDAKLIGADPQSDVALIKIESDKDLPTLPLGDSDALEVGEWVIAIGNPFGLTQTVTVGVVSATGRSRVGINEYENFIQTDAAINPGNSGGPLINIRGEAVGINSALYSRTGGYMGIGFAIPINMAKSIEQQLQKQGKVTRGWLGVAIQDVDEELARSFGLKSEQGILISDVQPDSPAAQAGLQQGDVITEMAGTPLKDVTELRNRVAMMTPGSTVELQVMRQGEPTQVTVEIGEQPADFGRLGQQQQSQQPDGTSDSLRDYGLLLQELTPELAEQLGYQDRTGVLISEVAPGSSAAQAGLSQGQLIEEVNKVKVGSVDELKKALQQTENRERVLLLVRSGNFSHYVVLTNK